MSIVFLFFFFGVLTFVVKMHGLVVEDNAKKSGDGLRFNLHISYTSSLDYRWIFQRG